MPKMKELDKIRLQRQVFSMKLQNRDFRDMIFLHYCEGKTVAESQEILHEVFQDQSPSYCTVEFWFKEFEQTNECSDSEAVNTPVTPQNIEAVKLILKEDSRVTYKELESVLNIGSESVRSILHDFLYVRKLNMCWVPQILNEEQKLARMEWCEFMLKKFQNGVDETVGNIVLGVEFQLYQYTESKKPTALWTFLDEDYYLKWKHPQNVQKKTIVNFFNKSGNLASILLKDKSKVNPSWYLTKCLPELFEKLKDKRQGILLHHSNITVLTAAVTMDYLTENSIQLITHPAHSPDLSPWEYFIYPRVKKELIGTKFTKPGDAVASFVQATTQLTPQDWTACFKSWFKHMELCVESQGNYFRIT
ncbi:serine-rich adhesin for platelets-like isoform X6 [Argonauta hians]